MLAFLFALLPTITAAVAFPINDFRNDSGFGRRFETQRWVRWALFAAIASSALALLRMPFSQCSSISLAIVVAVALLALVRLLFHLLISHDYANQHWKNLSSWPFTRSFMLSALVVLGSSWLALVPWTTLAWMSWPFLWLSAAMPLYTPCF